ncbi:GTPase Era [Calothrix sp. NIES-4101]|nr:GTPase Era [Calothrix sp. NIES-4101]
MSNKLKTINIAIAGHTNTGKTSLIRTLMKSPIGEVGDCANVTKKGEAYYFESLQATFIDTPGFQYAPIVMMCLDAKKENPEFKISEKWESKINYDRDAIAALEDSDVVIYVASLSVVPDDSYQEEISIIRHKSTKIVGVINQYKKQLEATNKDIVDGRVHQWESFFREQSIEQIVVFDAHWDNPIKVNQLYKSIFEILNDEQKSCFTEGLRRFKDRQQKIRKEACKMLSTLIIDCRNEAIVSIPKKDSENKDKIEEAQRQLVEKINHHLYLFVEPVSLLYKIAAENPTTSEEEIIFKIRSEPNWRERAGIGANAAAVLAALSGLLGGIIGFAIVPGTGFINGFAVGSQLGTVIGGAIGSLAIFSDENDTVAIKLDNEQLKIILIKGLAIIWGLSSNGYGRAKELTLQESRYIEEDVSSFRTQQNNINLMSANESKIVEFCEKLLNSLESESKY